MDRRQTAYQFYLDRGYSPAQAAGIVGGLRGETADFNTRQVHDGGIGLGISGWNGPRLNGPNGLIAFAQNQGADPHDFNTQLAFVDHELRTSEGNAFAKLQAATTPEDAGNAMLLYFRPKDYNVPGAHPERARYAAETYGAFNGGGAAPAGQTNVAFSMPPAPTAEAPTDLAGIFAPDNSPVPLTNPIEQPLMAAAPSAGEDSAVDPALLPRGFRQRPIRRRA